MGFKSPSSLSLEAPPLRHSESRERQDSNVTMKKSGRHCFMQRIRGNMSRDGTWISHTRDGKAGGHFSSAVFFTKTLNSVCERSIKQTQTRRNSIGYLAMTS